MNNLNTTYIDNIAKDRDGKPMYPGDLVLISNRYASFGKYLYMGGDSYFDGEDIADYKSNACYKISYLTPKEEDEKRVLVCKYKEMVYTKAKEDDINEAFKEGCIGIVGRNNRYVYYNLGNYTYMEDDTKGKSKPCTVYLRVLNLPCSKITTSGAPRFISQLLSGDRDTAISLNMQEICSYFLKYHPPHDVWNRSADKSFKSIPCPYPIDFIICDRNKPLRITKLLKENSFTVYNKEITIYVGDSITSKSPAATVYSSEIFDVLSNYTWELP